MLERLGRESPIRAGTAAFRRAGDGWSVTYAGRPVQLSDLRGFEYLLELLANPGLALLAVDLQGGVDGGTGPVLDESAKSAYRRRLDDLEFELDEAEAHAEMDRAAWASAARDRLARELARAVGLAHRDRALGAGAVRARFNVTRAIRTAMARISRHHADLGRHLELAVRTGTYCASEPDPALEIIWTTR